MGSRLIDCFGVLSEMRRSPAEEGVGEVAA